MDLEMWMAAHDECGPPGCGACATIDYRLTDEDERQVAIVAALQGKAVDVLLAEVLMRHVGRL